MASVSIWLIGELKPDLPATIFPQQVEILKVFFHKRIVQKIAASKAITEIIVELTKRYSDLGLDTALASTIRARIGVLVKEYADIKKNKNSTKKWQLDNVAKFIQKLIVTIDLYQPVINGKVI
jgi:ABC-type uncharacterized transport system involved in gliding motility auxiliary subunit